MLHLDSVVDSEQVMRQLILPPPKKCKFLIWKHFPLTNMSFITCLNMVSIRDGDMSLPLLTKNAKLNFLNILLQEVAFLVHIYLCTALATWTNATFKKKWTIFKRPIRDRLFGFTKYSSPPPHYVLPSIGPSLYKLFFSILAHIYLRHGEIFLHGETWPLTFIKVTWAKIHFFKYTHSSSRFRKICT